ncbi:MAG TPA: hypothetical protein PLJ74_11300, partial [Myxococcota bacterium]|nr:hypothetical protein [Myxococcota bacterium]
MWGCSLDKLGYRTVSLSNPSQRCGVPDKQAILCRNAQNGLFCVYRYKYASLRPALLYANLVPTAKLL